MDEKNPSIALGQIVKLFYKRTRITHDNRVNERRRTTRNRVIRTKEKENEA